MATAEDLTVTLDALPDDLEAFLALRDRIATTPQGGVVTFILAARLYSKDKKLGADAFTVALDRGLLQEAGDGYKGFKPSSTFREKLRYLDEMPWAANTYVVGTTPQAGYQLPAPPFKFHVFSTKASEQGLGLRLMAKTSGADMPRPFTVKKNDKGIWKVAMDGGSSFFTGMKKPGPLPSDDL